MITTIIIPEALRSGNELIRMKGTARGRRQYAAIRDTYQAYARAATRYRHPARFTIEYYRFSVGTLDEDNLHTSGKILIDACKKAGLIVDDRPKFLIKPLYEQIKIKRNEKPQTILKIIDVDEFGKHIYD